VPVSLYIGLALSFSIFYAFADHELDKSKKYWFTYFIIPVLLGILGVFNYWSSQSGLLFFETCWGKIEVDFLARVMAF